MKKKVVSHIIIPGVLAIGIIIPVSFRVVSAVTENAKAAGEAQGITLTFPIKGEVTSILKPNIANYIAAMHKQAEAIENDYILHDFYVSAPDSAAGAKGQEYSNETDLVRIANYANTSIYEEESKKVALVFKPTGFNNGTTYTVKYGLSSDLSDATTLTTQENYVTVQNLLSGATYYWQVSAGTSVSSLGSFKTEEGFRMITASGVSNIRDMGGRPVAGGKHIKQGLIFRGGELVPEQYTAKGATHSKTLYDGAKAVLQDEIKIKYEVDLRGDAESNNLTQSPLKDENHSDIDYIRVPDMMAYDAFITKSTSDARWPIVREAFLAFKNAETKHVYFHCWGGADRTGTLGFMLGALLGMSYTDLIIDFELTSFSCNYRPHHMIDPSGVYWFPNMIRALRKSSYYAADKPLSQIVEDLLIDKTGLTAQDFAEIRENLLED